jgi:sRNA-binding protein
VVRTRQSERVGIWGRVELAAANESLRRENQGLKEQLAVALQKKRRVSGGDVSAFLAWIGSPCLRHCVHGASIGGGGGGTAGVAGAEHAAHARRRRRRRGAAAGQRRARSAGRLARRRWGAAALGCAAERTPDSTEQMINTD